MLASTYIDKVNALVLLYLSPAFDAVKCETVLVLRETNKGITTNALSRLRSYHNRLIQQSHEVTSHPFTLGFLLNDRCQGN